MQLEEDPDFQTRSWRVQRLVWLLGLLVLVAGLLGFTGGGPLSAGELELTGGAQVHYPKFARFDHEERIRIKFPVNGPAQILIGGELQHSIEPLAQPAQVFLAGEGIWYRFDRTGPGGEVEFSFQPELAGRWSLNFASGEDQPIAQVPVFIYP
jgi:hypothetical protein